VKTSALHWLREEEMRASCQAGDPEPPADVASNPPWRALKHQPSSLKDLHLKASSLKASKIAQSEERKERINSWQLMYCGGAQAVIKSLQEIHEKYKMPLKIESFDW
jgi:hypothetical protein